MLFIKKIKTIPILVLATLSFCSCGGSYEQYYVNYPEYETANIRNKSWFPDIIKPDALELRSVSDLSTNTCFGSFKYSNKIYYDSLFADETSRQINYSEFLKNFEANKLKKPKWFPGKLNVSSNGPEITLKDRFYLIRDTSLYSIYFFLSD